MQQFLSTCNRNFIYNGLLIVILTVWVSRGGEPPAPTAADPDGLALEQLKVDGQLSELENAIEQLKQQLQHTRLVQPLQPPQQQLVPVRQERKLLDTIEEHLLEDLAAAQDYGIEPQQILQDLQQKQSQQ